MSKPVYASSCVFGRVDARQALQGAVDYGIEYLELSSGLKPTPGYRDIIKEYSGRVNVMVHNYFPAPEDEFVLNLASLNDAIHNQSVAHCENAITLCSELNIPVYSVHFGFCLEATPDRLGEDLSKMPRYDWQTCEETFLRTVNHLCHFAASKGVKLLLENNVAIAENLVNGKNELLLGVTSEEIDRMLSRFDEGPEVGLLLDTAHLKVSAHSLGFDKDAAVEDLKNWIDVVHHSDNDGLKDNNGKLPADYWFNRHMRTFADAYHVLEVKNLSNVEAEAQLTHLKNALS